MDQINPQQFEVGKKENSGAEAIIVFIELLVGLFLLFLIFAILNYFSILNLSKSFPVLSFLPQQKVVVRQAVLSQQDKTTFTSAISAFANETILPQFITAPKILLSTPSALNSFSVSWSVRNSSIQGNVTYDGSKKISQISLLLYPALAVKDPLTLSEANTKYYLAKYFLQDFSKTAFSCRIASSTLSICEHFATSGNARVGYGMLIKQSKSILAPFINLFACTIPNSSPFFSKVSSCLTL